MRFRFALFVFRRLKRVTIPDQARSHKNWCEIKIIKASEIVKESTISE